MGNNLDRIVTVSIDIASPIIDSNSFDNLLIFGPAPAKADHKAPAVGVYNSLEEVTGTGYVAVGKDADIVGVAARIAFSQSPSPSKVFIGTLAEDGDLASTLDGLLGMNGWYVICPVGLSEEQLNTVIEWTEAQKKMCGFASYKPATASQTIYQRSFGMYCKESDDQADADVSQANQCIAVGWTAKCLNYHAGKETWAHKTINGVAPSSLTSTQIAALEAGNISYFITTASKNISYQGKTLAGEWIDTIRFRDWLENDIYYLTDPSISP